MNDEIIIVDDITIVSYPNIVAASDYILVGKPSVDFFNKVNRKYIRLSFYIPSKEN